MPKKRAPKKSPARKKAKKPAARKRPRKAAPAKAAPTKAAPRRRASKRVGKRASKRATKTFSELEGLIKLMVEKEVVEVEFEESGARWRVRRAEVHAVAYGAPPVAAVPLPVPSQPDAGATAAAAGAAAAEPQGEVFKSPMVGTFYTAPSPDAEVFCKPGDKVAADRTLCIIEAMKVMNEIKAEREFEIVDALVKNGESVEFGQPLFLIR